MSHATVHDVAIELEKLGWWSANVRPARDSTTAFINVYIEHQAYPVATVWPPTPERTWIWGKSFEFEGAADADAAAVAARITETLRESS